MSIMMMMSAPLKLLDENLMNLGAQAFEVERAVEQAGAVRRSEREAPRNVGVRQCR